MAFVATKLALFYLILMVHIFIRPSFQVQHDVDFPVIDPSSSRYQYFSLKKNTRRFPHGSMTSVQVYDELACLQYSTRMKDSCVSVSFKKQAKNGLHLCEIVTSESHFRLDGLEEDGKFNLMSPMAISYRSCAEVPLKISGVYHILPMSSPVPVFCDMTTTEGGWTVIQKRIDGSVDFYRDWDDYKWGFGNKFGEYWLGLENIHAMTSQRSYRLRFDMEDFGGEKFYAEYSSILVSSEADNYRVTVGTYSAHAGDSFTFKHNGMQFTTKDRDNDLADGNCAVESTGAWWYNSCHDSNPNGQYLGGPTLTITSEGIIWKTWSHYSLKRVEMKIRPV